MRDQNHLVRFEMNVTFTLVSPDTNKRGQILPECKLLQDGYFHCKVASDILQGVLVGVLFEGPSIGLLVMCLRDRSEERRVGT